jgi:hypothetical protein
MINSNYQEASDRSKYDHEDDFYYRKCTRYDTIKSVMKKLPTNI